jgi:hypothetical protein
MTHLAYQISVFMTVMLCGLVGGYKQFLSPPSPTIFNPEDGGSLLLQIISIYLQDLHNITTQKITI